MRTQGCGFRCDVPKCKEEFETPYKLKLHKNRLHRTAPTYVTEEEKIRQCPYCKNVYKSTTGMKLHMNRFCKQRLAEEEDTKIDAETPQETDNVEQEFGLVIVK